MGHELVFVALFLVATAVALVARALRTPYTVALVVTGLALGATRMLHAPHLTRELLYAVFLPGLVFEAAFHLDFKKFWANKLAITALAVPGLLVAISLTAVILVPAVNALGLGEPFTVAQALVFAALIAATDPIAVVGLFKSLGAPKRLVVLVEGESLLNDGTAVVVFSLVLAYVTGTHLTPAEAALSFVRTVGGGLLVGAAVGYATSKATHLIEDAMIEITLTTIAAYGSFALAERLHLSGVIATVVAGMLCGNYGARSGMSPSTRLAVESFWEYVAFALNSVVFLLIGFEVRVSALLHAWRPVLLAFLAVVVARAVVVSLVGLALGRTRERFPAAWVAVITWGGLRGGLSMVLALALPRTLAHRDVLVTMTFGVVVLSILGQGLTMAPLLRRLKLVAAGTDRVRYEVVRGAQRSSTLALAALDKVAQKGGHSEVVLGELRADYTRRLAESDERLRALHLEHEALRNEERHGLARQLLLVEKDTVQRAHHDGVIGAEAAEELLRDVDARLVALEVGVEVH
jgi:monovalent cation:H+ antiporter, CPA1 family